MGRTGAARRGATGVGGWFARRGRIAGAARERILTFSAVGRASRRRQEGCAEGGGSGDRRVENGGARATGQSPLPAGSCSIHGYVVREDFPRKTGSVIARRGSGPVASHGSEGESESASDETTATATAAVATTATTTATGVPSGAAPG